eukprot:TRINITY_DN2302_c0_g1_i1.p1 TRINITY_DN2302_c0_g1~~TRINITY_DN2302_c0_g1_i1.p1  ORF type:complete len:166 (+),score=44.69 TRINITY_DN2302_c0_g1_i1:18-515(+)
MAKIVVPKYYKWQLQPYWKSNGPLLRHMSKLTVSYYPHSPNLNSLNQFLSMVHSKKQQIYKEKQFEFKEQQMAFGERAKIDVEYRNGEKLTLDAEGSSWQEIINKLRIKRLDMEEQMDWVMVNTHITIEEEAAMGGAADLKKDKDSKKKGGDKKAGGAKGGGKKK